MLVCSYTWWGNGVVLFSVVGRVSHGTWFNYEIWQSMHVFVCLYMYMRVRHVAGKLIKSSLFCSKWALSDESMFSILAVSSCNMACNIHCSMNKLLFMVKKSVDIQQSKTYNRNCLLHTPWCSKNQS